MLSEFFYEVFFHQVNIRIDGESNQKFSHLFFFSQKSHCWQQFAAFWHFPLLLLQFCQLLHDWVSRWTPWEETPYCWSFCPILNRRLRRSGPTVNTSYRSEFFAPPSFLRCSSTSTIYPSTVPLLRIWSHRLKRQQNWRSFAPNSIPGEVRRKLNLCFRRFRDRILSQFFLPQPPISWGRNCS